MKPKTKKNLIELDPTDQRTLEELAAAMRKVSVWGKPGFKADVIRHFLRIYRESGVDADKFMRTEYIFRPLNP